MEDNNLKNHNVEEQEITVERKLIELYTLQQVDSKIDKIMQFISITGNVETTLESLKQLNITNDLFRYHFWGKE